MRMGGVGGVDGTEMPACNATEVRSFYPTFLADSQA